jgi:hypothetical protein
VKNQAIIRATVKFKARERKLKDGINVRRNFMRCIKWKDKIRNVKTEAERGDRNKEQKLT